ncbi:MAG TPA: BlaI/MecI/CopY family transcriptional regulator, partial [Pyrinomonadaceae bacterium]
RFYWSLIDYFAELIIIADMNIPRFRIRGFRGPRDAVLSMLGPLERKVLDAAWGLKRASVRDVVDKLKGEFAYTTIMTTLDRLYKKGYLDREIEGRAFLYQPRVTQEEMQIGILGDVITGLLDGATRSVEPVLASIVDSVGDKDRKLLDELERLVKEKKASIKKR